MLFVDRPNLMLETEHVTKMFVFKLKCYASDLSITRHCRLEAIAFLGFKKYRSFITIKRSKYKHARKELTYLCIISLTDSIPTKCQIRGEIPERKRAWYMLAGPAYRACASVTDGDILNLEVTNEPGYSSKISFFQLSINVLK